MAGPVDKQGTNTQRSALAELRKSGRSAGGVETAGANKTEGTQRRGERGGQPLRGCCSQAAAHGLLRWRGHKRERPGAAAGNNRVVSWDDRGAASRAGAGGGLLGASALVGN